VTWTLSADFWKSERTEREKGQVEAGKKVGGRVATFQGYRVTLLRRFCRSANGQPVKDTSGQPPFDIIALQENSGISVAVPAKFIAELAKKNNIDLN
jgi:hypothetical protein